MRPSSFLSVPPAGVAGPLRPAPRAGAGKAIGISLLAGLVVVGGVVAAAHVLEEPAAVLTRDVQDIVGVPWYTGAASTFSVAVWSAVAALSLLQAWTQDRHRMRLGAFGMFVLVLMADDAFLLHEAVGPENGVPQELFLLVYALFAGVLLIGFLRCPDREVTAAFLVGGALLAASVVVDQLMTGRPLLEDTAKILGAMVWLTVPLLTVPRTAPGTDAATGGRMGSCPAPRD